MRTILLAPALTDADVVTALRAQVFACFTAPVNPLEIADMAATALKTVDWRRGIEVVSGLPTWMTLRVACGLVSADRITRFLTEWESALPEDQRDLLMTAFREMLLNAMEHGAGFDPGQVIEVTAARTDRAIVFHIRDPGNGFNREALSHAAKANDPEQRDDRDGEPRSGGPALGRLRHADRAAGGGRDGLQRARQRSAADQAPEEGVGPGRVRRRRRRPFRRAAAQARPAVDVDPDDHAGPADHRGRAVDHHRLRRSAAPGSRRYEERFLFLLLLLRQPRARLIYVTSQAIHAEIVDYYLDLLPGVLASHAKKRLFLVSPLDGSSRPLTAEAAGTSAADSSRSAR